MQLLFRLIGDVIVEGLIGLCALLFAGKYVLPYLTVAESRELWKSLEVEACWVNLTSVQREFAGMLKAVGARDGRTMAAKAEKIFRGLPQLPQDLTEYALVAAGLLGNLTQGKQASARALWRDRRNSASLYSCACSKPIAACES